ncbi:RAB GTPase homolog 8A [Striga asiatica]|uniref:RAB GTPase homolog 8A n=1 Tax=Striga asiatica TaxID=4170 RepID=A0A5A7QQL4_STRAF|nr:RAB GTPase homolog 8A [Striga asiatica]
MPTSLEIVSLSGISNTAATGTSAALGFGRTSTTPGFRDTPTIFRFSECGFFIGVLPYMPLKFGIITVVSEEDEDVESFVQIDDKEIHSGEKSKVPRRGFMKKYLACHLGFLEGRLSRKAGLALKDQTSKGKSNQHILGLQKRRKSPRVAWEMNPQPWEAEAPKKLPRIRDTRLNIRGKYGLSDFGDGQLGTDQPGEIRLGGIDLQQPDDTVDLEAIADRLIGRGYDVRIYGLNSKGRKNLSIKERITCSRTLAQIEMCRDPLSAYCRSLELKDEGRSRRRRPNQFVTKSGATHYITIVVKDYYVPKRSEIRGATMPSTQAYNSRNWATNLSMVVSRVVLDIVIYRELFVAVSGIRCHSQNHKVLFLSGAPEETSFSAMEFQTAITAVLSISSLAPPPWPPHVRVASSRQPSPEATGWNIPDESTSCHKWGIPPAQFFGSGDSVAGAASAFRPELDFCSILPNELPPAVPTSKSRALPDEYGIKIFKTGHQERLAETDSKTEVASVSPKGSFWSVNGRERPQDGRYYADDFRICVFHAWKMNNLLLGFVFQGIWSEMGGRGPREPHMGLLIKEMALDVRNATVYANWYDDIMNDIGSDFDF